MNKHKINRLSKSWFNNQFNWLNELQYRFCFRSFYSTKAHPTKSQHFGRTKERERDVKIQLSSSDSISWVLQGWYYNLLLDYLDHHLEHQWKQERILPNKKKSMFGMRYLLEKKWKLRVQINQKWNRNRKKNYDYSHNLNYEFIYFSNQ